MQLIPVLDLMRGAAVQARGGERERYEPVRTVLAPGSQGDPLALILAYRDNLGARECYVADLDGIQGGRMQRPMLERLVLAGAPMVLMVDAGIADAEGAVALAASGVGQLVVGLETLRSFDDLVRLVDAAGGRPVVFSLDLKHGRPLLHPAMQPKVAGETSAVDLAERAVAAGVGAVVLLDVGRVGGGAGVDLVLLAALRSRCPAIRLLVGGGVGSRDDLERIRDAGCDAALVATAFHAGSLGAADVAAGAAPHRDQSSASTSR